MWTGDDIGARINIAFSALVASLLAGTLVMVISFASIVLALGMLMLIMFAPLFLLIGAHPGAGRGIALKWLEMLLGTVVKRIVLGFLLAILIGFYQIILSAGLAWFSQIALILAVGIGALMYRKPMLEAMNVINLGGSRSGLEGQDLNRHAKKGAAGAIGAVSGGAIAARSGYLNGGTKAALSGALGGAVSGGMMGGRSGNPMRAAQMGSGAGRRAASRQESSRDKKARLDDPFAYDKEQRQESKQAATLQSMADQYADDPEMQRRLEEWAKKNDRPVPRPGAGSAPAGNDSADGTEGLPGPQAGPGAGSDGQTPRPDHPMDKGGVLPGIGPRLTEPSTGAMPGTPRPGETVSSGVGSDPALRGIADDVASTQQGVASLERSHQEQTSALDDVAVQTAKSSSTTQDLAAQTLARVRAQAERDGHKPTPPNGSAR